MKPTSSPRKPGRPPNKESSERIHVVLPAALLTRLRIAAEAEDRSISKEVERRLRASLEGDR